MFFLICRMISSIESVYFFRDSVRLSKQEFILKLELQIT